MNSLLGITMTPAKDGTSLGVPMQIILLLTVLTLLPAIIMSVTPFLRIVTVLHFLRQALGTQTAPSNQVLIALALFLTFVVMQPVTNQVYAEGWQPLEAGQISAGEAWERSQVPIKSFLVEIRAGERHPAVRRGFTRAFAGETSGRGDERAGAGLCVE